MNNTKWQTKLGLEADQSIQVKMNLLNTIKVANLCPKIIFPSYDQLVAAILAAV